jgi:hypothetical protein
MGARVPRLRSRRPELWCECREGEQLWYRVKTDINFSGGCVPCHGMQLICSALDKAFLYAR